MNFENDILACLETLRNGGLILYPTDTVWGIGCDATNAKAVGKIYQLKNRKEKKSMIILVADEKNILKYITQPDLQVFDYLKNTTRPTTVIYQGATGLAENLVGKDGSIAIRIVQDEFCKRLLKRFRKPIVSTSANISAHTPPKNFSEITGGIKKGVDYIVQFRQDDTSQGIPSSIIKWNNKGTFEVVRP